MNTVSLTYNALLENEEEINYKKYIKSFLQSNVTFSSFIFKTSVWKKIVEYS